MVRKAKDILYFFVARYFRFFAAMRLRRWNPHIVVITGSNGKTTALALMEVQLGARARYSHGANSSFGIPFDILGLKRFNYSLLEWPVFALRAPFQIFTQLPEEQIYVVEADCDRPYEGTFLSKLLKPEVVVWLSSARTHSVHFEKAARARGISVDEAIAREFGCFAERAQRLVVVNADEPLIMRQLSRAKAAATEIRASQCERHEISIAGTEFVIDGVKYRVPALLPKEVFYAIAASVRVAGYFGVKPTSDIWKVELPPGRSSLLKGIKTTTIVDSTYNANVASVAAILRMVARFPAREMWLVLGDLTEQGAQEKEEHEKLARLIAEAPPAGGFKNVILVGPRLRAYTLPLLKGKEVIAFDKPKDALDYIREHLQGGETLVFKGARFLEGVVEHLLADPQDAARLCRREKVWRKRRAQWGL